MAESLKLFNIFLHEFSQAQNKLGVSSAGTLGNKNYWGEKEDNVYQGQMPLGYQFQ